MSDPRVEALMQAMRPVLQRRLGHGTLSYDTADELAEAIGATVRSHPDLFGSPDDPPTVTGTEVTRPLP